MSRQPLVTIGISTYNRADSYLPQALECALAQTYPNLEIVVSDNCSTDGTEALVRSHRSERINYFRQEINIGPNRNFNFCLDRAQGEYFLLLHDDDRIDPDFVETCMTALGDSPEVGVIRTGTRVIDNENRVLASVPNECAGLEPHELFLAWFDRRTSFYLCSTLYNTELLRASGGFNSRRNLFQDVVALAKLAVPYGRLDVPEVKASFRRHDSNKGSGDDALAWAEDSRYLLDLLLELMPEHSRELRAAGEPYLCSKCYRNVANIEHPVERWKTYLAIDRIFNRSYSPIRYGLKQGKGELKRVTRRLLRRQTNLSARHSGG